MFSIKCDVSNVSRAFDRYLSETEFAQVRALTETAGDVRSGFQDEMQSAFDQPTRWTLNAFRVIPATRSRPYSDVDLKDAAAARHYLRTQVRGGPRPKTGIERLLTSRLKYHGIIQTVTPARGARLNKHGNWSRGQMNQVLSAVQSQGDRRANTTEASRKRNRRRAGYFVPREGSKLSPGVYKRGARGKLTKILHFSEAQARYEKRLPIQTVAERVVKRQLPKNLRKFMREAARNTARGRRR